MDISINSLKKYGNILKKPIFPLILFLYPFIGVFQGVDISDTGYTLGQFIYPDKVDKVWKIATFLHHIVGSLMVRLPYGSCLAGINAYTTLIISGILLLCYFMLSKYIPPEIVFVGEFISASLCWCPRVILYNYLTYFFFTSGMLFLVCGLIKTGSEEQSVRRQGGLYLVFAGVNLGLNVMVRFPNIVETITIVIVFVYGIWEKKKISELIKEFFCCFLGFSIGFLIPLAFICARYGSFSYAEMIASLFSMTSSASDYTASGMLILILSSYAKALLNMLILIPCLLAGIVMFYLFKGKFELLKKLFYCAGLLLLIKYFFSRGILTANYYYYDCFFQIAMIFIIISLAVLVLDCAGIFKGKSSEKLLSLTAIFMILILPVGSNNYTYPLMNSLFFIAPVSLMTLNRALRMAGTREIAFPVKSMVFMLVLLLIIQSGIFHIRFSFKDGDDGTIRDTEVKGIEKLYGMKTTKKNAESLSSLYAALKDMNPEDEDVILFGNIPGISYVFDMKPAIFSSWPDLDSNAAERLEESLNELIIKNEKPLVIIRGDGTGQTHSEKKYNTLLLFMDEMGYKEVYTDGEFRLYAAD